ncbi:MAG: hypothetical protein HQK59_03595 [Deltaproteobacteria bacterium]|nr:hypothetical protein [Deltaproteobacteria bacterium]
MRKVVSNTGPLITLEKMQDGFGFIQKLYDKIIIPPKVLEEVSFRLGDCRLYLQKYNIGNLIEVKSKFSIVRADGIENLHYGEVEAISLAVKLNCGLLIEDNDGRGVAESLGITVSGIAGRVMEALERNIIEKREARSKIDELFHKKRLDSNTHQVLIQKILSR